MADLDLIKAAQKEAEEICRRAIAETPEPYRGFILSIGQWKRVGGTRDKPVRAWVKLPYMAVDGRIKWAQDEHRKAGEKLTIHPPVYETIFEITHVRVTIESTLYGTYSATSRVFVGGKGADATNPVENGDTSAIGRCLGYMGYGLYGVGIASADEVEAAMGARSDTPERDEGTPVPDMTQPPRASDTKPMSDNQASFIRGRAKRLEWAPAEVEAFLGTVKTSREASDAIDMLGKGQDPRVKPIVGSGAPASDTGKLGPYTELFGENMLWYDTVKWAQGVGIKPKAFAAWVMRQFGGAMPEAKRPADLPDSAIEAVKNTIRLAGEKGSIEVVLDDIRDAAFEAASA